MDCESPCKTCPFLIENFGKPNPPGYSPKEFAKRNPDDEFWDWYSRKNILRLFKGVAEGEVMICHATDPTADSYGGTPGKPGSERVCIGSIDSGAAPSSSSASTRRAWRWIMPLCMSA